MPQLSNPDHTGDMAAEVPDADFTGVLEKSEQILRQCFKEYQIDEVFLSFNGGKDCTVLLDITIELLKDMHQSDDIAHDLKVVYVRTSNPFRELEEFVEQTKEHYGLRITEAEGDMKTCLQSILEEDSRLKACLMGTRRTDPYSEHLKCMQKTDSSWPQLMRVSPLLDWSYHQIWSYIHSRNVPYCSLYNEGYTSIGSTLNTVPNPSLSYTDSSGALTYRPAWHLIDGALERAGRTSSPKITANGHTTCNGHAKSTGTTPNCSKG